MTDLLLHCITDRQQERLEGQREPSPPAERRNRRKEPDARLITEAQQKAEKVEQLEEIFMSAITSNQPKPAAKSQPSSQPSSQLSSQPYLQPSSQPSIQHSLQPSSQPSNQPTKRAAEEKRKAAERAAAERKRAPRGRGP
jgi:hypothetical protein